MAPVRMYSYVFVCIRMYSYVFVCIRMYSYVFVCIRMYSYVFVCIRMYSYVFVCIRMYSYVFVCIRMLLVCYSYVNRMYSYGVLVMIVKGSKEGWDCSKRSSHCRNLNKRNSH